MGKRLLVERGAPTCRQTASWRRSALELAEGRLRRLVAERLGVDNGQLGIHSQLGEDLGADEVDLLEIAVGMEEEFGLVLSDAALANLRTYGDLWASLQLFLQNLGDADAAELLASGIARVRVIRKPPDDQGSTLRAARITPRVIETIVDEVLWTQGVVRLEVACAPDTTDRQLARIAQHLARLRNHGVEVCVQRMGTAPSVGTRDQTAADSSSPSVAPHAQDRTGSPPSSSGTGFADRSAGIRSSQGL